MAEKADKKQEKNTIGRIMYVFYIFGLIGALLLVGQLIRIQVFFKPDPAIEAELTPSVTKDLMQPERGAILAQDGRKLAISFTSYVIAMDCSVLKDEFRKDSRNGAETTLPWRMRIYITSFETIEVHPTFFYESPCICCVLYLFSKL